MTPRGFSWLRRGRIPALDGLRAVSIALVLAAHAIGTGLLPMSARGSGFAGDVGVRTFFVLSGFLITTLLLRELEQRGAISLAGFYVRRAFRIFPAFYTFLFVIGVLALIGPVELLEYDLLAAASYTTNFHTDRSWWTGHLWSLAVEEQFYVVWPLVLVLLGLLRAWWFAGIAVLAAPLLRVALWYASPSHRDLVDQAFPCVFDALATGCLLAFAAPRIARSERCARIIDSRWFWLVALVAIAPLAIRNPLVRYGAAMTIANFAIAAVIVRCAARPHSRVSRVLERPGFVWLGTLSYSLYLWQQLFLNRHSDLWLNQFPVNIGLALLAATGCHYLIEKPLLRFADRWRTKEAPALALGAPHEVLDVSAARQRRLSTQTETATAWASRDTSPRETLA
jgi:peptidoglycan/LPS O-acetylase OafA/YrhL